MGEHETKEDKNDVSSQLRRILNKLQTLKIGWRCYHSPIGSVLKDES